MRFRLAPERRMPMTTTTRYSAAIGTRAFCAARQTACGVAGMARSSWPSASVIALMTAAGAAIAPASPQPLTPKRIGRARRHRHADRERRQVVGARHAVVHVARGHELAGLVVDRALVQRLADALRDAAMDLALDDHRVDDDAEIVDRGPSSIATMPVSGSTSTSQMWTPAGKVKFVGS